MVAEEVAGERLAVGRGVEELVGRDPAQRAGGHVSHRVAAGFTRGEPGLGQPGQGRRHPPAGHEVELEVLPGGDVAEAPRVLLRHLGQRLQLLGGDQPLGELRPEHVQVALLPLAVVALEQAEGLPLLGADLAALPALQLVRRSASTSRGSAKLRPPRRGGCVMSVLMGSSSVARISGPRDQAAPAARSAGRRQRRTTAPTPASRGRGEPSSGAPASAGQRAGPGAGLGGGGAEHGRGGRGRGPAGLAEDLHEPCARAQPHEHHQRGGAGAERRDDGRYASSACPETTVNPAASPRWVSGMPASAGAASAEEMPGMTSCGMPGRGQRLGLLAAAAEDEGIAGLEPHHPPPGPGRLDQDPVDGLLLHAGRPARLPTKKQWARRAWRSASPETSAS